MACRHEKLTFGGCGYFYFCTACNTTWCTGEEYHGKDNVTRACEAGVSSGEIEARTPVASKEGMNIALADEVSDLAGKNMRLEAENEQLKKDVEHWKRARESALAAGDIMRDQLEEAKEWMEACKRTGLDPTAADLRTENERLRAAINYFDRNSHEDNWPQQAERLKEALAAPTSCSKQHAPRQRSRSGGDDPPRKVGSAWRKVQRGSRKVAVSSCDADEQALLNERLREELVIYAELHQFAWHHYQCKANGNKTPPIPCSCGYEEADEKVRTIKRLKETREANAALEPPPRDAK